MSLLVELRWPIALVAIAVLLALIFKRQLAGWISRWNSMRIGLGSLRADVTGSDARESRSFGDIDWQAGKVANIYWLGHDLMYTLALVSIAGTTDQVKHGLRQSLKHLRELGLPSTYVARLQTIAQEYSAKNHQGTAERLARLRMEIGYLLAAHQEKRFKRKEE